MKRPAPSALALAFLATMGVTTSWAQVPGAPAPIPVPPIPAPPQLGAAPRVNLPAIIPPGRPPIGIPDAAQLDRLPIPPEAAITSTDPSDKTPPPKSGALTGATAMISPGDAASQIEESMFIVDPGSSQLSAAAQTKLTALANELARDKAARLEIRTFSPAKPHSESTARRLSLARFLAIREVLTHNGVSEGRIDGRPLTSTPAELNADRVELYIER